MKKFSLLFRSLFVVGALLFPIFFASATTTITSNITGDTTWSNDTYVIDGAITIDSGVTLTIGTGTIVKFKSNKELIVSGTLNASGVSGNPIYFTSFKDDIGGDTNGDGTATSPADGDWKYIITQSTGSTTISHAIIRYGGNNIFGGSGANLQNAGGVLNMFNATSATSSAYALRQTAGTTTVVSSGLFSNVPFYFSGSDSNTKGSIATSTLEGNGYGVQALNEGRLSLVNNSISSGSSFPVYVSLSSGLIFTHSGNTLGGANSYHGYVLTGSIGANQTWAYDTAPYIIDGTITVPSDTTLTIEAGSILKFKPSNSEFVVNGSLDAEGTTVSPIYFTSLKDDSVGGDTNNDSSGTAPAAENWKHIEISSTGSTTLSHAVVRYGGWTGSGSGANIYNTGGKLTVLSSTVATSSTYGIRHNSGTTTILTANIFANSYGVYQSGGLVSIFASSTIHNNVAGVYVIDGEANILSNQIYDNTSYGIYTSDTDSTVVDVNYIRDNSYGVYVNGGSSIRITSNHILDNTNGIYVNSSVSVLTIGANIISGNSSYGIFNNSGSSIPGTYNYWGASDGPSGQGAGSGDAVSTNVDYDPFLTQAHYVLVDENGDLLSSVDSGDSIHWEGGPGYLDEWYYSLDTWNALGNVDIATDTAFTVLDLTVSTTSRSDVSWAGAWSNDPDLLDPDTLTLNTYYMDSYNSARRKNVILHELGHALGLAHSYLGNLLNYSVTETTSVGSQDSSDYNYLWP
jgi:parallel beta-helix repeat protein